MWFEPNHYYMNNFKMDSLKLNVFKTTKINKVFLNILILHLLLCSKFQILMKAKLSFYDKLCIASVFPLSSFFLEFTV
jgi:hypothetical protein